MTDPRTRLIASMTVFGTLGIFVSLIPLPSALIVMVRAVVGTLFVGGVMLCKRQRPQADALKQNARLLLCSGVALGLNWTLLFEAYRHTTVAVATLCYYMAPVFLLLLSPIVLKEPMTRRKAACVACSLLGAALVSGAAGGGSVRGVALGLAAAALYCAIMLMNKKMQGLASMETTFAQLCISALVITPYALLTSGLDMAQLGAALVQNTPMPLLSRCKAAKNRALQKIAAATEFFRAMLIINMPRHSSSSDMPCTRKPTKMSSQGSGEKSGDIPAMVSVPAAAAMPTARANTAKPASNPRPYSDQKGLVNPAVESSRLNAKRRASIVAPIMPKVENSEIMMPAVPEASLKPVAPAMSM